MGSGDGGEVEGAGEVVGDGVLRIDDPREGARSLDGTLGCVNRGKVDGRKVSLDRSERAERRPRDDWAAPTAPWSCEASPSVAASDEASPSVGGSGSSATSGSFVTVPFWQRDVTPRLRPGIETRSLSTLLVGEAALGAAEPAVLALAGAMRPEQLAGHPGAAVLADHPSDGLVPAWRGDHLLDIAHELHEVYVSLVGIIRREHEVMPDQFGDVSDGVGHSLLPSAVVSTEPEQHGP